jgi:hypothetical protein
MKSKIISWFDLKEIIVGEMNHSLLKNKIKKKIKKL